MGIRSDIEHKSAQSVLQGFDLLLGAAGTQTPVGVNHWKGFRVYGTTAEIKANCRIGDYLSTDGTATGSAISVDPTSGFHLMPITHIEIATIATSSPVYVQMIR